MTTHSPEQVTQTQHSLNPLRWIRDIGAGIAREHREEREWRRIEQQSKLYADAVFTCWFKGLMTNEEELKAYEYEEIKKRGLSVRIVHRQEIYRLISIHLGERDKHLNINWKLYKIPPQEDLTSEAALIKPKYKG